MEVCLPNAEALDFWGSRGHLAGGHKAGFESRCNACVYQQAESIPWLLSMYHYWDDVSSVRPLGQSGKHWAHHTCVECRIG